MKNEKTNQRTRGAKSKYGKGQAQELGSEIHIQCDNIRGALERFSSQLDSLAIVLSKIGKKAPSLDNGVSNKISGLVEGFAGDLRKTAELLRRDGHISTLVSADVVFMCRAISEGPNPLDKYNSLELITCEGSRK